MIRALRFESLQRSSFLETVDVLHSRKDDESAETKYSIAQEGLMDGVKLSKGSFKEAVIGRGQFYQALCDSIRARMLTHDDSMTAVIKDLNVVMPQQWPFSLPPEYGEAELKCLCAKFTIPYSVDMKNAFRDYKAVNGDVIESELARLFNAIFTLPVSTAVC
jgi:hypothetical protein